jgi:PKD repeat protein
VTETPYISTTTHLNYPYGIGAEGNYIWIGELLGRRALKYNADGGNLAVIGRAGVGDNPDFVLWTVFDVAVDGGGNIWVVDGHANHVLKFDPSGNLVGELGATWQWGSGNDRFGNPNSIAFDSQGNIYVSDGGDWWTGDNGNHRIQVFDSAGNYKATLGTTETPGTGNYQFHGPAHIAIYNDYLYVADRGNHRVQIYQITFSPSFTMTYVATLGETGVAGDDNDHFDNPSGVAVDASYIYVADTFNHRVQVFNRSSRTYVTTIGGYGSGNGQFDQPYDVAVDASGYLYVADFENSRVQQFRPAGGTTWNWWLQYGVTGVPYVTDGWHYNDPEGVAVAADGSIYIAENYGRRLVKLSADGTPQWAKPDIPGVIGYSPNDVAVGQDSRVYLAAGWEDRIRIYNPDGTLYASFGGYGNGNYQFADPQGLGVAPNGDIYVADCGNHRVQVYRPDWSYKATLGVNGQAGSDNAHFDCPRDVAIDGIGTIYVADEGNHRVQVFDSNRNYVRTIGITGTTGNGFDRFSDWGPHRLAVDSQNRLYVTDAGNTRVQVFDSTGAYLTTIGGSWGMRTGQLRGPSGIAIGPDGSLYVADSDNHRIQKFAPGVPGWKQVNINGFGNRDTTFVSTLDVFGGYLYAGTWSSQMWRTADGQTWSQVAPSTWPTDTAVFDAEPFGSYLYVGTASNNGGEIWRTNGIAWEQVVTSGFGITNNHGINALAVFSNTIYAATSADDGVMQIYRSASGDAGSWSPVVTDGFGGGGVWQDVTMDVYGGYLYLGIGRAGVAELWHTNDGVTWSPVFTDGLAANNTHVSAMAEFNGAFYIGLRNVTTGGEVWRTTDGTTFTRVFDGGLGDPNNGRPYGLQVFNGRLYLVFSNPVTGAEVWRTSDGMTWEQVGDAGWGDSNNGLADYYDKGATVFNNRLYIGTTNWANGGEVWKKTVTADFTASPTVGSPGTTVTFTNLAGGDVLTTTWNFGDGSPALTVAHTDPVTHTYTTPGVYTVTLTVEDGVDTDVRTRTAYIQIAHRIFLPLVLRAYNPLIALYDDFNNSAFDGLYNPLKWRFWGDENYFSARQQGGMLVITNTANTPANTGLDLPLAMPMERTLRQVQRFQARMMVSSGTSGTGAKIQIMHDINGSGWWTQCSLNVYGSAPDFGCDIVNYTPGNYLAEYGVSWPSALAFDTWYTARIDINPNTAQVCFYLNNNLLGCHTPSNANALKTYNDFVPRIGSWNGNAGATGTRYFDDIYITPAQ